MLEKKIARQAALHRRRMLSWRRQKIGLLRQIRQLKTRAAAVSKLEACGVLNPKQVERVTSDRRLHWTAGDVSNAVGLRCISRRAYAFVQQVFKLPLPSCRTLQRWTRGFRVSPGIIEASVEVIGAVVRGMTSLEKLCVISFDEVSIDARWCHDQTEDLNHVGLEATGHDGPQPLRSLEAALLLRVPRGHDGGEAGSSGRPP